MPDSVYQSPAFQVYKDLVLHGGYGDARYQVTSPDGRVYTYFLTPKDALDH